MRKNLKTIELMPFVSCREYQRGHVCSNPSTVIPVIARGCSHGLGDMYMASMLYTIRLG